MNQTRIVVLLPLLLSILCAPACVSTPDSAGDSEQAAAAVRAVIEAQAAAWNRGDIEGYMDGYERAETTTFISGDAITRGWQTVLERYKKITTRAPRWARSPSRSSTSNRSAPSTRWPTGAGN